MKNARAIRALHNAGFWIRRVFSDPIGGPFLLMWTDRPDRECPFRDIRLAAAKDVPRLISMMEQFCREEKLEWVRERTVSAFQQLLADPTLGYVLTKVLPVD